MKNKTKKIMISAAAATMGTVAVSAPIATATSCSSTAKSLTLEGFNDIVNFNANLTVEERNMIDINPAVYVTQNQIQNALKNQMTSSNLINGFVLEVADLLNQIIAKIDALSSGQYGVGNIVSAKIVIKNLDYNNGKFSVKEQSGTLVFDDIVGGNNNPTGQPLVPKKIIFHGSTKSKMDFFAAEEFGNLMAFSALFDILHSHSVKFMSTTDAYLQTTNVNIGGGTFLAEPVTVAHNSITFKLDPQDFVDYSVSV